MLGFPFSLFLPIFTDIMPDSFSIWKRGGMCLPRNDGIRLFASEWIQNPQMKDPTRNQEEALLPEKNEFTENRQLPRE